MKYPIGTRVKFKKINDGCVRNFTVDPTIPLELIMHGSIRLGQDYYKNGAIIKGTYQNYYLVSYIGEFEKEVCLGFREEDLKPYTWRERLCIKGSK
jgi:hypothetical protein